MVGIRNTAGAAILPGVPRSFPGQHIPCCDRGQQTLALLADASSLTWAARASASGPPTVDRTFGVAGTGLPMSNGCSPCSAAPAAESLARDPSLRVTGCEGDAVLARRKGTCAAMKQPATNPRTTRVHPVGLIVSEEWALQLCRARFFGTVRKGISRLALRVWV